MKDFRVETYEATEQLRDGRQMTIRAIRPVDRELLREAFQRLEEGSIRLRFFGPKKELTDEELKWATEIDFVRNVALVSCVRENTRERIIGVGRYVVYEGAGSSSVAEIAFVVEEDYQGQGVASMLFKHLALIARHQNVSQFRAEVLPGNKAMLRVFERSGLPVETDSSSDSIHVSISLHHEPGSPEQESELA